MSLDTDLLAVRLMLLGAPKVLVFAVLLLCWSENINQDFGEVYTFLELFAGSGNASRTAVWAGHKVASVDILYWEAFLKKTGPRSRNAMHASLDIGENPLDANSVAGLATLFTLVLKCKPKQFFVLAGMKCSSMIAINKGTSGRSFLNPMGNQSAPSVRYSNALAARMSLVLLLTEGMMGAWLLEQARSSVLIEIPRMRFVRGCVDVWQVCWWKRHYDGDSPKRHVGYSNSRYVGGLSLGKLQGWDPKLNAGR
eukprot:TRINITY_DN5996_c0_g1_i1.p1 TRINITY_DN5996_c0_g1~~TRINITY_DN5996_c0_g1_i1.p1  ORF type:complete len:253 (-),score=26.43 TRINITY_DN5996_c0_g1_i1:495-1253(-)